VLALREGRSHRKEFIWSYRIIHQGGVLKIETRTELDKRVIVNNHRDFKTEEKGRGKVKDGPKIDSKREDEREKRDSGNCRWVSRMTVDMNGRRFKGGRKFATR